MFPWILLKLLGDGGFKGETVVWCPDLCTEYPEEPVTDYGNLLTAPNACSKEITGW